MNSKWKLVPVEPTEAMIDAGYRADSYMGDIYRAMLDAAPPAPCAALAASEASDADFEPFEIE